MLRRSGLCKVIFLVMTVASAAVKAVESLSVETVVETCLKIVAKRATVISRRVARAGPAMTVEEAASRMTAARSVASAAAVV